MFLKTRNKFLPYLLLLPTFLILIGIILIPSIVAGKEAFFSWNLLRPNYKEFNGLGNFKYLFSNSMFLQSLKYTVLFIVVTLSLEIVISLLTAIFVSRQQMVTVRGLTTTIILIPFMLAPLTAGLMWKLLFSYDGLINYMIQALKIAPAITWSGNSNAAFLSTIIAEVWRSMPFAFLLWMAALTALPIEPYEAAQIDGANGWQQFRYITFPLLIPTLTIIIIYQTVLKFRVFDLIYILTRGGPGYDTLPLGLYLYRMYFGYYEAGKGSGVALIMEFISILFSYIIIKHLYREQKYD